ncbi:uncharacterized protein CYBJADRAFT_162951 [Cyberlindnera jadinii NRRL Y-1542]|uniref:ER membrane protein complex subunit 7 beta-sandwich domain-containing protein n=1 Tax=Cyberlindnera jadinii (strain ATCC 18201 / CBS 1600 / BCRC 20928 / JCM 3617 / NBRC 0987 / NRRL Y-1542) TaxID=983966 RepID=A0A1E4S0Q0_CYBJN|nr:hypothetical protein CYBJADRAFT_162951 [Cyberlindnera jadinii NRRL Y-1542]ODV73072.1 hypothetical protein CYBJADRAFT_162951 [Cyberlindnera jadinii NRRL Y-1542]
MRFTHSLATLVLGSLASCGSVKLLAQDINSHESLAIGTLNYDEDTLRAEMVDSIDELPQGCYRLGVQHGMFFKGYGYDELESPSGYDVTLTTTMDGEIFDISFTKSSKRGLTPHVKQVTPGPWPLITYQKETATAQQENTEEPEEAAPQTFMQKYWMYILPVGIFLLLSMGDPPAKNNQQRSEIERLNN